MLPNILLKFPRVVVVYRVLYLRALPTGFPYATTLPRNTHLETQESIAIHKGLRIYGMLGRLLFSFPPEWFFEVVAQLSFALRYFFL